MPMAAEAGTLLPSQPDMTRPGCTLYRWNLAARLSLVPSAAQHLRAAVLYQGHSSSLADDIELAFEEAVANVIKHTYHEDPTGYVSIRLRFLKQGLELVLRDQGPPIDLSQLPAPDSTPYLKNKHSSGMGLHLMRKLMDQVAFSPGKQRGNSLRLFKRTPELGAVHPMPLRLLQPIGPHALAQVQSALCKHGSALGLDSHLINFIEVAINEVGTNVMDHSRSRWFEVSLRIEAGAVMLVFQDDGIPFDTVEACGFMDAPFPYVDRHMGLYMLGRMPFKTTYRRLNDAVNELVMRMALHGPLGAA